MFLSNGGDDVVLEQARDRVVHVKLEPCLRAVRRIPGYSNAERLREVQKGLLDKIWMMLDLENGGLDASVAVEIKEQSTVIVAVKQSISQPCLGALKSELRT